MTDPSPGGSDVEAVDLIAGLDDQQRLAAETLLGPVCLLAGAGTGKTRAITHRIAYGVATGVYAPNRVMALTFTTRAAAELGGRLRALGALGVSSRTFHSAALRQLAYFWPQTMGGTMPRLVDQKAKLIAHAAESLRLRLDTATLRDVAGEIEWRKISRLTMEQYADQLPSRSLPPALSPEQALDLHRAYESVKDDRRQLDFEDVLLATAGMLEVEPRVAQQVREQYRFFVVDEYQDVSPLQQDLLDLWLGDRNDICVVGDASQTIYSFAGASADFLLGFANRYDDATVLRLEQNYRSSRPIVEAANQLMRGRPGALDLHPAAVEPGPAPRVADLASDSAEARAVAESIAEEIRGGTPPESIAVLFRVNIQAAALERALDDLGISTRLHGAGRFFDQREVKQALMMLKGAAVSIVGEPLFKTVSDVLRSLGWAQEPPEQRGAVRDRWESLNALMGLAEQAGETTTLKQFVDELFARQAGQHEPTMSAVTLATLHSAKGLEWSSVYIIGLSEGLLPISYATDEASIDEERRLLYVGITRARDRLRLSWSHSGQGRGQAERRPSRFLQELRTRSRDAVGSASS